MRRSLLARIAPLFFLGSLCYLPVLLALSASQGHAAEEANPKTIARLIDDLSSESYKVREAATHRLAEMEEAKAALREAQKLPDAEVRRRVKDILHTLEWRALRHLNRAQVLARAGRAVEAADRLVKWGKTDTTGRGWDSLTQFARLTTLNLAPYGADFCTNPNFPAGDFQRYAKHHQAEEVFARKIDFDMHLEPPTLQEWVDWKRIRGKSLFGAEEISIRSSKHPMLPFCIFAASGNIQIPCASLCLIIAGGDLKMFALGRNNLVICDGDVEVEIPNTGKNVIVARGKVTSPQGKLTKCLIRSGHTLQLPDGQTFDLNDGTPDPLAFVKFFELADVGITAEDSPPPEKSDAKGVLLKEVRKGSPFVKALRPGDRIIALEEKKTPTTEIFRRILRRKLAEDEPTITFTVRRSGKMLDVPIPMKD